MFFLIVNRFCWSIRLFFFFAFYPNANLGTSFCLICVLNHWIDFILCTFFCLYWAILSLSLSLSVCVCVRNRRKIAYKNICMFALIFLPLLFRFFSFLLSSSSFSFLFALFSFVFDRICGFKCNQMLSHVCVFVCSAVCNCFSKLLFSIFLIFYNLLSVN